VRLVTPVSQIYGMVKSATPTSLAVRRRRESRSEEWREHIRLAELLAEYLDPACTFWTSLENKPISAVTGMFQKMRGVRRGLPDVLVIYRDGARLCVIFIELKSRRGVASKAQKQIRSDSKFGSSESRRQLAMGAHEGLMGNALSENRSVYARKMEVRKRCNIATRTD